ncbi:hypothetical protein [Acuticoccus kandeliae]|uniref:hypothetical protein n=1 Tax=Acuticoccus kandeliae TaxID=2073160 RepID=UPI000D3EA8C0|nr:hypothetical protein [Acuticoccus kandeliae]
MATITITLKGDGHKRLLKAAEALGARGRAEMKRSLISGGRKTTTEVKKALVKQTSIKKRAIDNRVSAYFDDGTGMAWVIKGTGTGVQPTELQSLSAKSSKDRGEQPRDALGRFADWPNPGLAKGRITASVWGKKRTFAYSELRFGKKGGRGYKTFWPGKPAHHIFGPAPAEEIVKDQAVAAFHHGPPRVAADLERRIIKLSGGAFS